MGQFDKKWSDELQAAVVYRVLDCGVPAADVHALATSGQLEGRDGRRVPASGIPLGTVRGYVGEERKRRIGKAHSKLSQAPHVDAVELLRQRMVNLLDSETLRLEREQNKYSNRPLDAEHVRKVGRALRELAAMPEPGKRGPRPGTPDAPSGEHVSQPGSMKGGILAAMDGRGFERPAGDPIPGQGDDHGERVSGDTGREVEQSSEGQQASSGEQQPAAQPIGGRAGGGVDGWPGAQADAQAGSIRADRVVVRPS